MSHHVFRSMLALGQSHHPIHLVLVTLEQRDSVTPHPPRRAFQLVLGSALKNALRFGKAVEEEIARRKITIAKGNVRVGRDKFLGYLDGPFKSACLLGGKAP